MTPHRFHFRASALLAALATAGCLALGGCTPLGVAAGAGATVGIAAAREGGITVAATDAAIRLEIINAWFQHDVELYRRLGMTVREGRVLVTGTVPTPDDRVEAIRLVWQVNGVKQVINEVRVDEETASLGAYVKDAWITGNIKTLMMFDKRVQSINYTVETVAGTVYLMGVAQDQPELDRVIDHARNTKYVKNVVSYVRLRGEPAPGAAAPAPQPMTYEETYTPLPIAPADSSVESMPIDDMATDGY